MAVMAKPGIIAPRLVIFDWDGTLCDSLNRIAYCLQLAARDVGLPVPSVSAAKAIVGLGMREALEQLFPGIGGEGILALRESYGGHFVREDRESSPFFPGVRDSLERLREQGFLIAIATGKTRKGLDRSLQSLDLVEFFDATRCADETASKPDPAMLVSLLEEHALSPDHALMVGDTTFDMAMAQRLNMPRLAVSYGAHSTERLLSYSPLACVDDFREIHAIISP